MTASRRRFASDLADVLAVSAELEPLAGAFKVPCPTDGETLGDGRCKCPVSSIGVVVAVRRGFEAARRWTVTEGLEVAARVRRTSSIGAGARRRKIDLSWVTRRFYGSIGSSRSTALRSPVALSRLVQSDPCSEWIAGFPFHVEREF